MAKFRKKPVIIDAVQFSKTTQSVLEIYKFVHGEGSVALKSSIDHDKFDEYADAIIKNGFNIITLEGTMKAFPSDWIIKGIKGEFYPCKDDIFQKTYEAVE